MNTQTVTIHLPEHLWHQFQEAAQEDDLSLENMLLQAIQGNRPPSLVTVPARIRPELRALKTFSDTELWQIAESRVAPDTQTRLEWLLAKNQDGTLTVTEKQELEQLSEEAERLTVKKAFAYTLLRWRGHPIPTLDSLDTSS
jgi:transposase